MKTRLGVEHEQTDRVREWCRQFIVEGIPLIAVALVLGAVETLVVAKLLSVSGAVLRFLLGLMRALSVFLSSVFCACLE